MPGPSYCGEGLQWNEKSWAPNVRQQDSVTYMSKTFYDHLYKVLRQGEKLYITPRQVRVQIGVIEECQRQNRLSKMTPKGWPAGT